MDFDRYRITGGKFSLKNHDTSDSGNYKDKGEAAKDLAKNTDKMIELQDRLFAQNTDSIVIILQAMDAAGKDGVIKHVMSGVNPQGCHVTSFRQPSSTELDHDYLWRFNRELPERGMMGIFNRSYYEDVVVVRVHDLVKYSQLPLRLQTPDIFKTRYRQIRDYEKYLFENGINPIKIFLNVSKEEQRERLLSRTEEPDKNWKFSYGDVEERKYWDEYMKAFNDAIEATSTEYAPWYIVPADKKWFSRLLVSEIIVNHLEKLNPQYPVISDAKIEELEKGRVILLEDNKESKPEKQKKKGQKKM